MVSKGCKEHVLPQRLIKVLVSKKILGKCDVKHHISRAHHIHPSSNISDDIEF